MTTPTRTPVDRYPTGDPVSMTQVIGEPYETTDERGEPVGIAEHIVAVTGVVDEVGDVFVPGGFTQAMKRVKAKGVSGHDWGTKVSKALDREEWMPGDPRIAERIIPALPEGKSWPRQAGAVYVRAQYNLRTPEGKRAYENAKFFGADECYSVGYKVRPGGARKRGGKRYLSDFDWYEWSDVLHGANSLAFGLSVKGLLDSELEYSGGRLIEGAEVKAIRRVKDSKFWGLPIGTVIRPGMKPRGPKALALRRAGEVPDPAAGTTTKKPAGRGAPGDAPDRDEPSVDDPELTTVGEASAPGTGRRTIPTGTGTSTDKLAAMGKRDTAAAAAEMTDDELAAHDEELSKRAEQLGRPGQQSPAHQAISDERTKRRDSTVSAGDAATTDDAATRVADAVRALGQPGDFVRLADVRAALDDMPAAELDALLKRMSKSGEIHLAPDSNRKAQTDADRAAAITVGGEPNHLIALPADSTPDDAPEDGAAPDAGAVQDSSSTGTGTDKLAAMGGRDAAGPDAGAVQEPSSTAATFTAPPPDALAKLSRANRTHVLGRLSDEQFAQARDAVRKRAGELGSSRRYGDQPARTRIMRLDEEMNALASERASAGQEKPEFTDRNVLDAVQGENFGTDELASTFGVPQPKMLQALRRLEQDGYLVRNSGDDSGDTVSGGRRSVSNLGWESAAGRDGDHDEVMARFDTDHPDAAGDQPAEPDPVAGRGQAHLETIRAAAQRRAEPPTAAPLAQSPAVAELTQLVDDTRTRAVLAGVLGAPDADTARQMGRDLARKDPEQARAAQAEAGSVAEFAGRDKGGYPEVHAGLDKLSAFEDGTLETPAEGDGDTTGAPDTAPDAADTSLPDDAPADEVISADDIAAGDEVAADAHGLIEADDGELEVTAEVGDRQDRVEALLEGGEAAVKALDDTQLPDSRRDVADEIELQDEIARRDRENRRARAAKPAEGETPDEGTPPAEDAATAPAEPAEGEDTAPAEPAPQEPQKAKTRAGLAGAAEDYADALEAGDETAATEARTRLESSLRRSRSESAHAQALRDLLAGDDAPDPARLRELATAMRDDARKRRNEQAKSRRLAKRLERERLRSLLGQIDAEMRTRGLSTDEAGGGDQGGVISAGDLAAGQAAAAEPPPAPEQPAAPAPAAATAEPAGLPPAELGVWSDPDTMPVTVRGAHYEASVDVDPDQPNQFTYEYHVTGPDGTISGNGAGKERSVDDARRSVIEGLTSAFNNPHSYGGVPDDERLPNAPDAANEPALPTSNIPEGSGDTTDEGVLSPEDLAAGEQLTEGADNGPDRGAGGNPLAEVPAGDVQPNQGPGAVLPGPGDRGAAADRAGGGRPGTGAAAGGDVPAAGGLAGDGGTGRGIGGAAGDGAAAGGGRDGDRGRDRAELDRPIGDTGGPATAGGDERLGRGERGTRPTDGGAADTGKPGDRGDDAGLTDPGVTERDQPQPDVAAVNRVPTTGQAFTPTGREDFAPPGERAKLNANMDSLRTLRSLQFEDPPRAATPDEQATLARWAGWGGLPKVFDDDYAPFAAEREELRALLSPEEWNAARRNTLNAHYTDPRAVTAIWQAVQDLGVTNGRVLEPGSGSGNFIGLAPEQVDMIGVELDPTTAAMSKYLYPDAEIRNESFARSRFPDGAFDASVGNVPFGDFKLTDRRGNKGRHSIHNHFIIKSMQATRPGGIVAMLTSRYTMDSQDSKARSEMAELGDLLGAVRLPTGSHRAASGTDVIEDVLIFRRREEGSEPVTDQGWIESPKQSIEGANGESFDLPINSYWAAHPDHVLGEVRAEAGRYGSGELIVDAGGAAGADTSLDANLAAALRSITDEANANGLGATVREGDAPELVDTTSASAGGRYEGNIGTDTSSGDPAKYKFSQIAGGELIDITEEIPVSARAEFAGLLNLRATFGQLLDAESATGTDTPQIVALRAELNRRYEAYVSEYGAVTRYTYTKSGARQRPAAVRLFRRDPKSAGIRALESNFDPTGDGGKGSWSRASIFTKRSAAPREISATADNPKDALALSLESTGRIDLPAIGEMLGILSPQPADAPNGMQDTSEVRAALGDLVFEGADITPDQEALIVRLERARQLGVEPDAADSTAALDLNEQTADVASGPLETASEYLSGDVRRKLAVARHMARHDPRYQANVAALESVVPTDLGPAEIEAKLGASWIPPDIVRNFVRDLHGSRSEVAVAKVGTVWTVNGPRRGNAATEEWGTDRRTASELVQAMLEQRPIRITTKDVDGNSVYDLNATLAAQAKVEALAERFSEWAWEDPQRARKLADNYNWQFNGIALRNYDGAVRSFPGMAAEFTPRPHQVAAVERIVNEPTAMLAHVVGAGKTAEMVMGTAELKRLGLARKPAIVVPNHMLEQFTREYLEIYPNANVLAAGTDDLTGDKRKDFVARAATGDWDAVILTQKAFEAIPMSPDQQEAYIQRELSEMREALENAQAAAGEAADETTKKTVKKMEKALLRAEEAMRKKLDKEKDSAVSFEQTGIDYLMVDEAHHYSNLRTLSNIPNAGATGSNMATDLHMKMEYLREHNQSGRVATFATGTPVRNTVTQTFIMQRYLRPDLLREAGISSFDAWAATFGQIVEEMELKPEGNGFRQTSRFAKFQNVPELLRMMHVFADVKMAEDLDLPTPNIVGGKTETVTVGSSAALDAFIGDLGERAEKVRSGGVPPEVDNMLKISGDGRKAALSMKLVGQDHEPGKIEAAAERISGIYADNKDRVYPVDPDNPAAGDEPDKGALQIVFLDLGTPKSAKGKGKGQSMDENDTDWNGYEELRTQLAERGVPPEQVAFIHDARNDAEKAEMFARARAGKISVLIGSTEKMGVGTNVQRRAVALHHLDAPWRPSDVEQRDGRIVRQGNLNPDVQVIRYVTEGSFDAYMWQTLERKSKFINQIMRGSLDVREIEDVGDTALSYAEVKALATGNPDLMAKAKVDTLKGKLERLLRTHTRTQTNNANMVGILGAGADQADRNAELYDAAAAARVDTRGDAFRMEFAIPYQRDQWGKPVTKRDAAADGLRELLGQYAESGDRSYYYTPDPMVLGRIGGHRVVASYERRTTGGQVVLRFEGVPGDVGVIASKDVGKVNLLPRIERALEGFEGRADSERDRAAASREEAEKVRQRVGIEFPRMAELEAARAKAARIAEKMQRDALRDEYRKRNVNWNDPKGATGLDEAVLTRLRFDPRTDSDEFDSPLLERDTSTDHNAGQFESEAARVRLRASESVAAAAANQPATPETTSDALQEGPYRSVAELRAHLEQLGAAGYTPGNANIDWSTVLMSPGGGLFLFRSGTGSRAEWKVAHTGSGLVVTRGLPGGRAGAKPVMGALERIETPNGRPIDWTLGDGGAVVQNIRDSGFSPAELLAAAKEMADPTSGRPMTAGEARSLLRDAVRLNLKARGHENRESRERDRIISELRTAGYPADVDAYEHPSDVPNLRRVA